MTEEEDKDIKDCDSIFICLDDAMSEDSANDYRKSYKILKNLIKKQSKEIEHQIEKRANQRNELAILNAKQVEFNKLVNTVNSYKGQFKRQQKEIEELKEDNKKKSIVIIEYQDLYEKLQDKIKAKIEEYKEKCKNCNFKGKICEDFTKNYNCVIAVCLKEFYSLLEKE